MNRKKWLVTLGITASVVAAITWMSRARLPEVQAAAVESRAVFVVTAFGDGQLLAGDERYLVLRKGGNLETLRVGLGTAVSAGQVLAVVDETKNAAVLRSALSEYRFAGTDLARLQKLVRMNAATDEELDEARSRWAMKQAALESARQGLEDSVVRAPVAGVVSFLAFREGDYVPDGSRIAVIEDRSSFQATIRVPVGFRGQLPVRAVVKLTKRAPGAVANADGTQAVAVEAAIENASPASDFDALNMDIRCRLPALPAGFALRDLVRVEIPVREARDVALVEKRALQRTKGKTMLFVLGDDGLVKSLEVKVESEDGGRFVVTGLPAGSQVVLPVPGLKLDQVAGKKAKLAKAPEKNAL